VTFFPFNTPTVGNAPTPLSRALGGTGVATTPAAPASFTPANPATTASTTLVMMGLGSTVAYTPRSSGLVLVMFSCSVATATAVAVITIGPRFGTGGAPANGVAVTGTRFGVVADITTQAPSTTAPDSVSAQAVLALTANTAYWVDLALATAVGADAATMTNVSIALVELS
jgi:hypothetical protein